MKEKVRLFLIREGEVNHEVLVFCEPDFPEAGTQVPGGTVDPGEELLKTVTREFYEESGIKLDQKGWELIHSDLLLHPQTREEQRENVFYRNSSKDAIDETFIHFVTGGGEDEGILFSYSWLDIDRAEVELIDWMGAQLKVLRKLKGF